MGKKRKVAEAEPEAVTANGAETATEAPAEAPPDVVAETAEGAPAEVQDERSRKGSKKGRKQRFNAISGTATIADVAEGYLAHMEEAGKSEGTVASYKMELRTAMAELGEETLVGMLTADRVQAYFESRRVTKLRSGKNKAKPSVDKTRRVLRLALVWAAERGIIEKAPLPEPEPAK